MKVIVHTDGGSRGNPGEAGAGAVIFDQTGTELAAKSEYLGRATNNEAEYRALLLGLRTARSLGADEVECRVDSELVAKQINGEYRVKKAELKVLYNQVLDLAKSFRSFRIKHVRRENNSRADALANEAMDRADRGEDTGSPRLSTPSLDELAARLYEVASTIKDPAADGIRRALQRGAIEVQAGMEVGLRTINAALTLASRVRCVSEETRAELCALMAGIADKWTRRD